MAKHSLRHLSQIGIRCSRSVQLSPLRKPALNRFHQKPSALWCLRVPVPHRTLSAASLRLSSPRARVGGSWSRTGLALSKL